MFSSTLIAIVGVVVVFVLFGLLIMSRYKVAKPNEALIITGRKGGSSGQRVVMGGTFVWPVIQQVSYLDLSARRINVAVRGAASKQGILLNADGVAIVRVHAEDEGSIKAVASRYLGRQDAITADITEVLAGALRGIIGKMTVDEILRDREAFAQEVAQVTESTLSAAGLMLDSFQIQDVVDQGGPEGGAGSYLRDLGRPEAARAAQEAAVAEANSRQISEQKRLAAEQAIALAEREVELQKASIKAETDAAKAKADAAGPLAKAENERLVITQQQLVADEQSKLTDKELDTTVRKPADAEKYRQIAEAEAEREAKILEAEAQARKDELAGEGEKTRRIALAEATRAEGEANAAAVEVVGSAEASAMSAKAEAYRMYAKAAIVETVVGKLPEIAKELAAPMASIGNMTVVSTDGASAVSKNVTSLMTEMQTMLKETVGIDLSALVNSFGADNDAAAEEPKVIPSQSSVKEETDE